MTDQTALELNCQTEFEKTCKGYDLEFSQSLGDYIDPATREAWFGWQGAWYHAGVRTKQCDVSEHAAENVSEECGVRIDGVPPSSEVMTDATPQPAPSLPLSDEQKEAGRVAITRDGLRDMCRNKAHWLMNYYRINNGDFLYLALLEMARVTPEAPQLTDEQAKKMKSDIDLLARLSDDIGRSRGANNYAMNSRAVEKLVDLQADLCARIDLLAQTKEQN